MHDHRLKTTMRGATLLLTVALVLVASGCTGNINSFETITDRGDEIRWLFYLSTILSGIIMAIVFGVLFYSLLRFRGDGPASTREGYRTLEIIWTAIPAVLLAVLFVFTIRTMLFVSAEDDGSDVLEIQAVGNQWWWEFSYPDAGIVTANELHVPANRPLQLELRADDVIHSFWVPEIGWKMDMIPGKTNTLTFEAEEPGVYDGACAEFCGVQHAWMRIRLVVHPPAEFDAWQAAQARPATEPDSLLAREGLEIFLAESCVACHRIAGTPANGQVGPDLTHFGSRATIGAGVLLNTPENLEAWLRNPQAIKPGVLMPGYDRLTEEEMAALVVYLESLE